MRETSLLVLLYLTLELTNGLGGVKTYVGGNRFDFGSVEFDAGQIAYNVNIIGFYSDIS